MHIGPWGPCLLFLLLAGCAAPYQLTYQRDLPQLKGSLNDTLQSENSSRELVLRDALDRYGLSLDKQNLLSCDTKKDAPADAACVELTNDGDKAVKVPLSVAAIIATSVDECLYETYQQNTSAISQKTFGSFLGLGLLAAGIVNSVANGPSGIATAQRGRCRCDRRQ